jgi:hypothetical protein
MGARISAIKRKHPAIPKTIARGAVIAKSDDESDGGPEMGNG